MTVQGEIDVTAAAVLSGHLGGVAARNPQRLVIDLAGVGFLDSAGLGALIWLSRTAKEAGGGIVLAQLTRPVARLLEISGVQTIIPVEYSVERAIARVAPSPRG